MALLCELQFSADKKGRWKLIFVKAHLKHASLCGMRRHGVCNPHWRGSPMLSLCPLIHLQPGSPSSSIPPSLLLFVPPTPHPAFPHHIWSCSVLLSQVWPSWAAPRMRTELTLYFPTSLIAWSWLVIYTLIENQTGPFRLGWYTEEVWFGGEGEAKRQLKPEVALTRLGPWRCLLSTKRHLSQKRQQRLMMGLVFLWKPGLFWTKDGFKCLLKPGLTS